MTRERLYYIGLSALAFALCHQMALAYNMLQWQWWLWIVLGAYAIQPIINVVKESVLAKHWQRRNKRSELRYFVLERVDKDKRP